MSPTDSWLALIPGLSAAPQDLRAALQSGSQVLSLPAGSQVFGPGHAPQFYLLLLEGSVKVQQFSESGRAIVLYRVSVGESCILTTACLVSFEDYPAEGVAETDIRAAAIPRALFDTLIAGSEPFRRFVFQGFSQRISDLFKVIEEIAFERMDVRLAQKLIALSHDTDELAITQQELAAELGTAREVVSRMMSVLQRRNWVAASRGRIVILNRKALEGFAHAG